MGGWIGSVQKRKVAKVMDVEILLKKYVYFTKIINIKHKTFVSFYQ